MAKTKKIKSFTVDEKEYDALVAIFKKYNVEVSVSQYVDACLQQLVYKLKVFENMIKLSKNLKIDNLMPYTINKIVSKKSEVRWKGKTIEGRDAGDFQMMQYSQEIDEYAAELEAQRNGRTPTLQKLLMLDSSWVLSEDQKYITHKRGGPKFKTYRTSDGLLTTDFKEIKE
jgi:hypothetical protein